MNTGHYDSCKTIDSILPILVVMLQAMRFVKGLSRKHVQKSMKSEF